MVDNRSAGILSSIAGGINFRADDNSGNTSKTSDDRASQGTEYFMPQTGDEQSFGKDIFIDRSMELRASLNSLALLNVVSILRNSKKKSIFMDDEDLTEKIKPYCVEKICESSDKEHQ